ncbi:chorismate mutase [Metabacillus herbersteinensis]|uniref:chorismate mutase n=1 Tax=Metabacillus herbersteinensis TaxID=283816 RepID=A0ABV6GDG4_9BACI
MIRGIRGATTVHEDDGAPILQETEKLLREMITKNQVNAEAVTSILISVTQDIKSEFPAKALRKIDGWNYVPIMCMQEIPVPDSLEKCIRVLMTVNTEREQKEIHHVYLENAVQLRPDLSINQK